MSLGPLLFEQIRTLAVLPFLSVNANRYTFLACGPLDMLCISLTNFHFPESRITRLRCLLARLRSSFVGGFEGASQPYGRLPRAEEASEK